MYSKNIYLHTILRVLFDLGPRPPGNFSTPIHYDAAYSEMIFNVLTYSKKGVNFSKRPLSFSKCSEKLCRNKIVSQLFLVVYV